MSAHDLTSALWAARDFGKLRAWAREDLASAANASALGADPSMEAFFRARARGYAAQAREAFAEICRLQKKLTA